VPPPQASQWSSRQKRQSPVAEVAAISCWALAAAYEHALLHRAMQVPAQCTTNQRRVDTRLLSWQALSCWCCCEPPLARTHHRKWGDRLALSWRALTMHQLVIR
jgi:PIN domain nuclease of toxin-antitoxin system